MKTFNKDLEIGGISFGITSGIITTLGMIVGIDNATESKLAVIVSIFSVAIADSLSDSLGMHLSEESRIDESGKPVWLILFYVFWAKFFATLIFSIPFIIFSQRIALQVSVFIGLLIVLLLSFFVARRGKKSVWISVFEHLFLTIIVIFASYFVGGVIGRIIQ